MNKQEAIEKIESRAFDIEDTDLVVGLRFAQNTIKQIDEPKKAVVPQYIDTWIQGAEYNGFDLYEAMTDETPDKVSTWIVCNPETFAKAWLYGYEIEKEKLYIARNKTTGEHLYFNNAKKRFESGSLLTSYVKNVEAYHHTQDKLEKLNYWGNSLFEFEEVDE